jgi:nucleotide-binding universal stress UspA family protein
MNVILIATDGSPPAREAVEFGVELAAEHDAAVVFVHVVPHADLVGVNGFGLVSAVPHETSRDYDALTEAEAIAEQHGVRARSKLLVGDVSDEIVTYADDIRADLTIVGSRGRGGIASALLGSISRSVLAESKLSVLVVRGSTAAAALVASSRRRDRQEAMP